MRAPLIASCAAGAKGQTDTRGGLRPVSVTQRPQHVGPLFPSIQFIAFFLPIPHRLAARSLLRHFVYAPFFTALMAPSSRQAPGCLFLCLLFLAVLPLSIRAETLGTNLIKNGCFSNPWCNPDPYGYCVSVTGTYFVSWTITSGNVDPVNGFITPQSTNCLCGGMVDLYGTSPGTITQSVPVIAGNNYYITLQVSPLVLVLQFSTSPLLLRLGIYHFLARFTFILPFTVQCKL